MEARCVVTICEGSFRLNVFLSVPLSLFNMFFVIGGFQYLICSCSPCGLPTLVVFSFCHNLGPSILYLFPPFSGCFILLTVSTFENMVVFISRTQVPCLKNRHFHKEHNHFFGND